ncbi:alpha-helical pore-forming toxin family protein, partial [Streptomyces albireticuli]|nr:alpha-helical pore-forming toxin family protein [Streptomyces albireticuli]
MVTWRDKTKPMTVESLKGIQEYAKTYLEVVSPDLKKRLPKLQSGNKEEFKRYKSDLEILWKTFKTHEEHLKDASNGILTLFNNLSNDSAVFTTDLEVAKGDIATEKIKEQHIKDSIQSFKDEISRARKWELIGLVFGPLGYGIARIWGDNIANIQGLEKKISELESNLEKEHQEAVVLTSLLGRLSILANT